jgi:hypothetical protein
VYLLGGKARASEAGYTLVELILGMGLTTLLAVAAVSALVYFTGRSSAMNSDVDTMSEIVMLDLLVRKMQPRMIQGAVFLKPSMIDKALVGAGRSFIDLPSGRSTFGSLLYLGGRLFRPDGSGNLVLSESGLASTSDPFGVAVVLSYGPGGEMLTVAADDPSTPPEIPDPVNLIRPHNFSTSADGCESQCSLYLSSPESLSSLLEIYPSGSLFALSSGIGTQILEVRGLSVAAGAPPGTYRLNFGSGSGFYQIGYLNEKMALRVVPTGSSVRPVRLSLIGATEDKRIQIVSLDTDRSQSVVLKTAEPATEFVVLDSTNEARPVAFSVKPMSGQGKFRMTLNRKSSTNGQMVPVSTTIGL